VLALEFQDIRILVWDEVTGVEVAVEADVIGTTQWVFPEGQEQDLVGRSGRT
jgi:hypothetical protein